MTNYGSFQWKLPSIRSMQASIICHGSVGDPLLTMNVLSCSGAAGVLSRRKVSVQYTFTEYLVEPTRDRIHHKRTRQTTKKRAKTNKKVRPQILTPSVFGCGTCTYILLFDVATDTPTSTKLRMRGFAVPDYSIHGSIIFFRSDVISTRVEHATS